MTDENTQIILAKTNKNTGIIDSGENNFLKYLRQVQKFPILSAEEEHKHAVKFVEEGDKESAKMLIQSHLRLVVKIAGKYRNYGLPISELVSEGNLGLMQALKKFDPKKGFRFSTYSMWWIKAYIQDYVLRSWSLVKIGTTAAQKKLFFNLGKIKKKLGISSEKALAHDQIKNISQTLNVSEKEVIDMDSRLSQGDTSLNNIVDDENEKEMIDSMSSNEPSQEEIAIINQTESRQKENFRKAFLTLNDREKDILLKRQLSENPSTLEELSKFYNISRERIRQIEENAIKKIKKLVEII